MNIHTWHEKNIMIYYYYFIYIYITTISTSLTATKKQKKDTHTNWPAVQPKWTKFMHIWILKYWIHFIVYTPTQIHSFIRFSIFFFRIIHKYDHNSNNLYYLYYFLIMKNFHRNLWEIFILFKSAMILFANFFYIYYYLLMIFVYRN